VHKLLDTVQHDAVESLVEHIELVWQKIAEDVRLVSDDSLEKSSTVCVDVQLVTECYMHDVLRCTACCQI